MDRLYMCATKFHEASKNFHGGGGTSVRVPKSIVQSNGQAFPTPIKQNMENWVPHYTQRHRLLGGCCVTETEPPGSATAS